MIGHVVTGLLGWSNKRGGVEFYRYDPKTIPRHTSEWGDLLAMEEGVKGQEGCAVICLVLPRGTSDADVRAIEAIAWAVTVGSVIAAGHQAEDVPS